MLRKKLSEYRKKNKDSFQKNIEEVIDEFKGLGKSICNLKENIKNRYEGADDLTKKKIKTGLIGTTAIIAGLIGLKKIFKKKDKEEENKD